jgi:hypothetical protein
VSEDLEDLNQEIGEGAFGDAFPIVFLAEHSPKHSNGFVDSRMFSQLCSFVQSFLRAFKVEQITDAALDF